MQHARIVLTGIDPRQSQVRLCTRAAFQFRGAHALAMQAFSQAPHASQEPVLRRRICYLARICLK